MTKKILLALSLLTGLFFSCSEHSSDKADTAHEKMSVDERLKKARAAKASKRLMTVSDQSSKVEKATPSDYQTPIVKTLKGPNGEVVHDGERGAKFYINKNGNKTYLSSNQ